MSAYSIPSEFVEQPVRYVELAAYPGYRIGSDRTVWTSKRSRFGPAGQWRQMKQHLGKRGYYYVVLCLGNRQSQMHKYVHTLFLEAFVGPCPEGMECRHLDGNPRNNSPANICWGTPSENQQDKHRHGTSSRGERNRHVRLTKDDVYKIREMLGRGERADKVASLFNISETHAYAIKNRRFWRWLPERPA